MIEMEEWRYMNETPISRYVQGLIFWNDSFIRSQILLHNKCLQLIAKQ